MSDEILNKMLDLMVEARGKLAGIDSLASEVAKVNVRLERIERVVDGHTARFDRIEETVDGHTARFDRIDERLDRIEGRQEIADGRFERIEGKLDNIESELGTVKDAVLDVAKKVKSHDLAIKELREGFR